MDLNLLSLLSILVGSQKGEEKNMCFIFNWESIDVLKSLCLFFSQKIAYFNNKEDNIFKRTQNEKVGHDSGMSLRALPFTVIMEGRLMMVNFLELSVDSSKAPFAH